LRGGRRRVGWIRAGGSLKASELDLDGLLVRRPDVGRLDMRGGRTVLFDAAAAYRLAEELEDTLGREAARGVLTRFGYQTGFQEATRLRTHFAWDSDLEWLRAGARVLTVEGAGQVDLLDVVVDRAQGLFRVVAVVDDAWEASEHKSRHGPRAGSPICHRLVGWWSGFGSAFLGDEVLFVEHECAVAAEGAHACRLEGRLVAEWGEEGQRHRGLYVRDAIGERLASRDREVLAQAVKIQEQEFALAAKRKVEEASRLKSEFLANISHELRTPLNSIIGYSDLLLAKLGAKLPETPRRNLERILQNAEHLLGLINSILDISKIEAGKLDVRLAPVDVRALLDRCVDDARVLVHGRPVEVITAYRERPVPLVLADDVRLRQCLVNVIGNACKFTERGSIRIDCRAISGRRSGHARGLLAISVTDTGAGIAPEHQALIFEPFRQVDASTARHHQGTGLGLAIVRELLGLMGGEVRLQSALGAGSTFTLVLPLSEGADVEQAPPTPTPPSGTFTLASLKTAGAPAEVAVDPRPAGPVTPEVLLIDDDPDAATFTREALDAIAPHARLRVEQDPIRGLASARLRPPALVLLDLRLPNVDGREVLRLLRQDERTRDVPVVVVSIRDDARDTLAEGALAALGKPVAPDALRDVLARHLPPPPAEDGA
jgi:signal transduction histidine kinase/CheY-like chemotaxis protein